MTSPSDRPRPAESGHWYSRTGAARYTVIGKNGLERNTTLRDARIEGLVPSVTTIIGCADKPALRQWQKEQIMLAALTLPRGLQEPEHSWLARVWTDSEATAKSASERGTAIHAAVQRYYEGERVTEWLAHAIGAKRAIDDAFPIGRWRIEESFADPRGYGGKVDLHSSAGVGIVIDFKTKEFTEETADKLKLWDEHAMQLAGYREGLARPHAVCGICFVSSTTPGLSKLVMIDDDHLARGWQMFLGLLAYWKAKNKYDSTFGPADLIEPAQETQA